MDWDRITSQIIKEELDRKGLTYMQLTEALEAIGVTTKEPNLRNKMSRGTFSAAFFIQCLVALESDGSTYQFVASLSKRAAKSLTMPDENSQRGGVENQSCRSKDRRRTRLRESVSETKPSPSGPSRTRD